MRALIVDHARPPGLRPGWEAAGHVVEAAGDGSGPAAGPTLGRRIMITGATGGVGRYAIQLARLGGALQPSISSRGSWQQADEAITALRDGTLHGKAVIDIN